MVRKPLATIFILAPFIFTFAFALDVYVPSIPAIRGYFSTSSFVIQLTVSIFMLVVGLGQLIMGPLSDHFGRRKIIILSTAVFTVGSILCALSPTATVLILSRIIQAMGASGMMVAAFAIVRDLYSGNECARIYSFLNSTIALSPLLAPIVGGYLEVWYGWQASFAFLSVLGVLVIILANSKVTETLSDENHIKLTKNVFYNYIHIAKNLKFLIYAVCAACGIACFFTFFSVSAYIIITLLHVPEQNFWIYFGGIGIVFFIGSLLSGHLVVRIGTYRTVLIGTLLITLSGILMLGWYLYFDLSAAGFMAPMMITGLGGAMVMGGGAGGAIEPFPEMAGTASALLGFSEFIFAFFVSTIVMKWEVTSTLPLAITLTALGLTSATLCISFYQKVQTEGLNRQGKQACLSA